MVGTDPRADQQVMGSGADTSRDTRSQYDDVATRTLRVPVLVVGAGMAGLASSIMLSRTNVDHVLIERRPAVHGLPKAHIISSKTMEIFRQLGIADAVYAAGGPIETFSRFSWLTSLDGPTPLHGRLIGHIDAWGGGDEAPRYSAATPCPYVNLGQTQTEPLLSEEAKRLAPGRIRYGQELVGLTQDDGGATARVRDVADGTEWTIEADYVLGADGGRTVGPQLGVGWDGEQHTFNMLVIHFSAQLHPWLDDPRIGLWIFVSPDHMTGSTVVSGGLVKLGPHRWGTDSEEWVINAAADDGEIPRDESVVTEIIRETLGIDDLEPAIHSVGRWTLGGSVAEHLCIGRVLLLGDAAHRHSPIGGLGANTAIADAQNATWKVAQVVKGHADPELLRSYEEERLPVARNVVARSTRGQREHSIEIPKIIEGLGPGEEGWKALERYFAETPEGEAKRAEMAKMLYRADFGARMLGVELGQQYESAAVVPDGTAPRENPDPVTDYLPEARPGHRVPHAWIDRGRVRSSTIDLAQLDRYVLVTDPGRAQALAAGDRSDLGRGRRSGRPGHDRQGRRLRRFDGQLGRAQRLERGRRPVDPP